MSGLVKICGLSRPEHAEAAARAGADLIGFLFADSRRRVEPATASVAISRAKAINPEIRSVGLFVEADIDTIKRVHAAAGIDLVQLHGLLNTAKLDELGIPALVVINGMPGRSDRDLFEYVDGILANDFVEMIMIDAYHPTMAGGTGNFADWNLAAQLALRVPLMLAGGLRPENVGDAIARVRPMAVDVSSGVEQGGAKSTELIKAFVSRAREGFAAVSHSTSSGTSSHEAP